MSTAHDLRTLQQFTTLVLERNLEGLSHEESLEQPASGGNCLNWVLGHILATRTHVHRLLGDEPVWSDAEAKRYERGSSPIVEAGPGVLPLPRLVDDLRTSSTRLRDALERVSDDDLAKRSGEGAQPVGDQLIALHFHEAYHAGQIGLLRRLVGKAGAIR
jgi:hypothetical protein